LNSELSKLVVLQKLDIKIYEIHAQHQKIPERIRMAQAPVVDAHKHIEELKVMIEKIATERRGGEQDLSIQESNIQKLRTRLNEIKTNKEYQAHLFEIEQANKKKDTLEERVLLVMERGEQKQQELDQWQSQVGEAEQSFEQEKAQLELLSKKLETELAQLEQEQQEIVAHMEKRILAQYTGLKSKVNVLALVPVRDRTCTGCRLQLPPQLLAEVKRAQEIITCAYCHRILYSEAVLEQLDSFDSNNEELPSGSVSP